MSSIAELTEANLLRNQQEYSERKIQLESLPYLIQIGADNRCNLRCGFCLAEAYREAGWLHLQDRKLDRNPLEIFQRLVPFMPYWKFLSLTGPGESLLNPRLPEILALVRQNSGCAIAVTTNGVLINSRLARILIEHHVDEISISLDSIRKDTYEQLRVNAEFEKAIGAIEVLNQEKQKAETDFPRINLMPTFMRKNIEELPDFIDFAVKYRIHLIHASPVQIYRRDWVEESLLRFPDLTRRIAQQAEKRAIRLGVRFINNLRMVYVNRGKKLGRLLRKKEVLDFPTDPSTCLKPWNSIFIEPDGEVRPCCYPSPVYGNIYETGFLSLWNGEAAQSLRRSMIAKDLPKACAKCYEFNRHNPQVMIQLLT
ncbi:MAG: radical SAM protein [Acidobacteria bacterium]|nr:radical SAM protein [Acidobacteriota bacterium]